MTTWSLVIATYKRAHILPRCLKLAAAQTRPASEIIVIDASPEWEETRHLVMKEHAARTSVSRLIYVKAERASSAAQRNQGVRLASSDVVVFIDDDSLMYPDCAEAMMVVYDLDVEEKIAGVGATLVPIPSDELSGKEANGERAGERVGGSWVRRTVRALLKADDIFVPYDADYPNRPIPSEVEKVPLIRTTAFAGCSASFRRSLLVKEPFENILERYASGEDSDVSYRVSRHGALVIALKAKIHHIGIEGGRLSTRLVTALGAMNPAVLIRIYSTEPPKRYKARYRRLLYRRFVIQLLKDYSKKDWTMPRARGIWLALGSLRDIFCRDEATLREWYPRTQQALIAKDNAWKSDSKR